MKGEKQFPKIFRFITESPSSAWGLIVKMSLVSMFSLIFILGIVQQVQLLLNNKNIITLQSQERQKITEELAWWEHVARQYQGYRDVYLQIATLQYRLGDKKRADESLGKVLQLDPNFQEALVLQEKLSL